MMMKMMLMLITSSVTSSSSSVLTRASPTAFPDTCSRALSREASSAATTLFTKALSAGITPSLTTCQLLPSRSIHSHAEAHKFKQRGGKWRCRACGKVFSSEHWMDAHVSRAHQQPSPAEDAVCLADHCEMLGCPIVAAAAGDKAYLLPTSDTVAACVTLLNDCFLPKPQAVTVVLLPAVGGASAVFLNATRLHLCEGTLAAKAAVINKPILKLLKSIGLAFIILFIFFFGLWKAYSQDVMHPITLESVSAARLIVEERRKAARSAKEVAADAAAATNGSYGGGGGGATRNT